MASLVPDIDTIFSSVIITIGVFGLFDDRLCRIVFGIRHYVYLRTCASTHTHACTHTRVRMHTGAHVHTRTGTYTRTHTVSHTHVHTHTHSHSHIHAHTLTLRNRCNQSLSQLSIYPLSSPATASSAFSEHYPGEAVDGLLTHQTCWWSNPSLSSWWSVDLGTNTFIRKIRIYNSVSC